MTILGAIIGGGRSLRFGSDKAAFPINGVAMIEHIHAALRPQVDTVVLCGRSWNNWVSIPDLPEPGLGPLGGLCGALQFAQLNGYDFVLTVPVDTLPVPSGLAKHLSPGPAAFSDQPLIGLWPSALGGELAAHLRAEHRSVRSWIMASGCRRVDDSNLGMRNINRPSDLKHSDR